MSNKLFRQLLVVLALTIFAVIAIAGVTYTTYIAIKRPGANVDAYISNITDGKLQFGTTSSAIGDLQLVGVNHTIELFAGAGADTFIPVGCDTDQGWHFATDFIPDSISVLCQDWSSDTLILTTYIVSSAGVETILSDTDTLIANGAVDLTGVAAATRDMDTGQSLTVFVDERGTVTAVSILLHGRSYDVQ